MPWWSWLLIWTGLVLGLLGMFAYCAWSLFRKAVAIAMELRALLAQTEVLHQRADELRAESFHPAVFDSAVRLRGEREQVRAGRVDAKQARRDRRVRRGKLLVRADPARFDHATRRTSQCSVDSPDGI